MKIIRLEIGSSGIRSVEIRTGILSYRGLLRCIRRIPGTIITPVKHDRFNAYGKAIIIYKDISMVLEIPFSDYLITCTSSSETFDEFISILSSYRIKWWEYII
jgi:hypothetical protein